MNNCTCVYGHECAEAKELRHKADAARLRYMQRPNIVRFHNWAAACRAHSAHLDEARRFYAASVDEWGRAHYIPKETTP